MENHEAGRANEKQVHSQCNIEMTYGVFKIANYPVKSLFLFTYCFSPIGLNRTSPTLSFPEETNWIQSLMLLTRHNTGNVI